MKKISALIVSFMFLLTIPLVSCSANDDAWKENIGKINLSDMTVSGNGVSVSDNTINITEGGDFEVFGTLSDGLIYVNTESRVKLRLSGMNLTNKNGPAIFFDNVDKGFITITENTENFLADGAEYNTEDANATLFSNDDLEIKGSGTLNITGNSKHGLASDDDLTIENGVININSYEHGIKVNNTLSVAGGKISVKTETGKGFKAEEELIIDGGEIDIDSFDEGIESKGLLTINGGDINIVSQEDGINAGSTTTETAETTEGIAGTPTEMPRNIDGNPGGMGTPPEKPQNGEGFRGGFGGRRPENGEMTLPADGSFTPPEGADEMPSRGNGGGFGGDMAKDYTDEEGAAAHSITINGGNIYISAVGDGIDSNGNLYINGGTVTIDGPESSGNGPFDYAREFKISGGVLIATSSAGMIALPRGGNSQNILSVTFDESQEAGTVISVVSSESGEEIMSVTPAKKYQALVFSAESLESDKEYIVKLNGADNKTVTAGNTPSMGGFGGMGGGRGPKDIENKNFNKNNIKVKVNGSEVSFNTSPVIKNDSTLVGFRAILEALGATVTWNAEKREVLAEKDGISITLTIGSTKALVNGDEKNLLVAPEIINDSTMIPVRFISEEMGMNVDWNGETQLITVSSAI